MEISPTTIPSCGTEAVGSVINKFIELTECYTVDEKLLNFLYWAEGVQWRWSESGRG
jgi:hypothetical protein